MMEAIKELFGQKPGEVRREVVVIEVPPLMRKGEYEDVIAIPHPLKDFTRFTNVPYVMGDLVDGRAGFEWGYSGCGPTDFAFNILLHFTDHDEVVARAYHMEFRDEFLKDLPREGGRIPKMVIFDFIKKMAITKPGQLERVRNELDLMAKVRRAEILPQNRGAE
jgi:hypothetical protein